MLATQGENRDSPLENPHREMLNGNFYMLPVFAIMGRPNVGKSTLFNRLTKTKAALVANYPGLTRDRQYGNGVIAGQEFIVIDTGGIGERDDDL